MILKTWLIYLVFLTLLSCVPEASIKQQSTTFYDIQGLIDEQINLLLSISPSVSKKATINGNSELTNLTPKDSSDWAKELNIFRLADINRSILRDSYMISQLTNSGVKIISYKSKDPDKTDVEELTVELNDRQQALKIHASLDSRNELFNSAKVLELNFTDIEGKQIISSYKIQGRQKMISIDSTSYLIEASITFN